MSKRIWHHPEVPAGETTVAWRSAGQLEDTADIPRSGWTASSRKEPPKWPTRRTRKPRAARSSS